MLIFGYGPRRPRDHGPVLPDTCPVCGNHTLLHLLQQTSWVSFFFVPVIPASTTWALLCSTCGALLPLDKATARQARDVLAARASHEAGRGDTAEYASRSAELLRALHRVGGPFDQTAWTGMPVPPPSAGTTGPWAPPGPPPGTDPWSRTDPWSQPDPMAGPGPDAPPDPGSRRPDPPAGWYADPFEEAEERYWDGERWTRGTMPPTPATTPDEPG